MKLKPSEVLIEAKKHLARNSKEAKKGKQRFICYAIGFECSPEQKTVKDLIRNRLKPYSSLGTWLAGNKKIQMNFCDSQTIDRLQLTRHAWVDDLIQEFQSKGQ